MALAHVQQLLLLAVDHVGELADVQPLLFSLAPHLLEHPGQLGDVVLEAVPDSVAVDVLQTRLLQQPMKIVLQLLITLG